jgi:hypothetical protein
MSQPWIEPGPPWWEASNLAKSYPKSVLIFILNIYIWARDSMFMYIVCIPVFKELELEREKLGEINCTEPDTNKDFVYINIYILNAFFEFFRIQNAE